MKLKLAVPSKEPIIVQHKKGTYKNWKLGGDPVKHEGAQDFIEVPDSVGYDLLSTYGDLLKVADEVPVSEAAAATDPVEGEVPSTKMKTAPRNK